MNESNCIEKKSKESFILKISAEFIERLISLLPSKLIILTGVSCSGKSSLSKAMTVVCPDIIHIDVDVVARRECLRLLEEVSPELYKQGYAALGENLAYYAIFYNQDDIFSVKNIIHLSNDLKKNVERLKRLLFSNEKLLIELNRKITYELLDTIKQFMLLGRIVILDFVAMGESLKPFASMSPLVVTIYTPLEQLNKRLTERNTIAVQTNSPIEFRQPLTVYTQVGMFFAEKKPNTCVPRLKLSLKPAVVFNASDLSKGNLVVLLQRYIAMDSMYHKLLPNTTNIVVDKLNIRPKLIILDGLSTAGKTTTAEAYRSLHPAAILLHRSERQRKILQKKIPSVLKRENRLGDAVFCYAKYRNNKAFNTLFGPLNNVRGSCIENIDQICRVKQEEVFMEEELSAAAKAKKYINAGINVLLDNLIYKQNLDAFRELSPCIVLVYCPFENIVHHLKRRNDEALRNHKVLKWRDPYNVYRSYTKLYSPHNNLNCDQPLEHLAKDQVLRVLNKLMDDFPAAYYGINKTDFILEIFTALGLDQVNEVSIYPRLTRPDLVLNTKRSAEENALILSSFLNEEAIANVPSLSH